MLKAYDGGRLFGARTGTGTPWVLALHGWGRAHGDFDAVLGRPAPAPAAPRSGPGAGPGACAPEALDAVSLDLPGFGATPAPPQAWGSRDYARAVAPVLAQLAGDLGSPVVVLGHSLGGRVAVRLAAGWPELVRALVLSGVPQLVQVGAGGRRAPLVFRLGKQLHRRGLINEAAMESLRRRHGSADYRRASGVMREVLVKLVNERYEEDLGALAGPVELVWGAQDAEVPLAGAEAAEALLGERATLTVLPGVGHLAPIEAPAALRQVLERHRRP